MTPGAARLNWVLFAALGLIWGTSYLFIKIGVETLPTFTLVACGLGIGLVLLAVVVAIAREPLPRDPKMYGHLLVMSVVNIALPFALITWAEQSVDSALAAILNGACRSSSSSSRRSSSTTSRSPSTGSSASPSATRA